MPDKNAAPWSLGKEAVSLAGLADYQEGSIVSRTVLDKPVGTVTLFAFAAGQSLSEHKAPYDALVHVVDGQIETTIGGESVTVRAGEMIVMPANIPHALCAHQDCKMLLIMVRA